MDTHQAVLLLVLCVHDLAGELALFPHGHERGAQPHRNDGPEEEASRIQADDNIDLLRGRLGDGVRSQPVHEVRDEGLETDGVPEEREDV